MKQLVDLTPTQLRSIERTLSAGTWTITAGAVLFSVLTVTPLVQRVTPDAWDWTAPILPIVVDAAVVIVIRLDATVSRLGESGGRWPTFLRWLTGLFTLALNIGDSALHRDWVGVAVHAVAPLLLIVTAEAALAYRRAIGRALDRIARERHEEEERKRRERREREDRERRERQEREERERQERETRERLAAEEREREREARERQEREAREHELQKERERLAAERERREWEAAQEREREERERRERLEREERERQERERREREKREQQERERQEREARERREWEERERQREAHERRERERREQQARERQARSVNTSTKTAVNTSTKTAVNTSTKTAVNTSTKTAVNTSTKTAVNTSTKTAVNGSTPRPANSTGKTVNANDKMSEAAALETIRTGVNAGTSVRELARQTGWSLGWVSARVQELRDAGEVALATSGS